MNYFCIICLLVSTSCFSQSTSTLNPSCSPLEITVGRRGGYALPSDLELSMLTCPNEVVIGRKYKRVLDLEINTETRKVVIQPKMPRRFKFTCSYCGVVDDDSCDDVECPQYNCRHPWCKKCPRGERWDREIGCCGECVPKDKSGNGKLNKFNKFNKGKGWGKKNVSKRDNSNKSKRDSNKVKRDNSNKVKRDDSNKTNDSNKVKRDSDKKGSSKPNWMNKWSKDSNDWKWGRRLLRKGGFRSWWGSFFGKHKSNKRGAGRKGHHGRKTSKKPSMNASRKPYKNRGGKTSGKPSRNGNGFRKGNGKTSGKPSKNGDGKSYRNGDDNTSKKPTKNGNGNGDGKTKRNGDGKTYRNNDGKRKNKGDRKNGGKDGSSRGRRLMENLL